MMHGNLLSMWIPNLRRHLSNYTKEDESMKTNSRIVVARTDHFLFTVLHVRHLIILNKSAIMTRRVNTEYKGSICFFFLSKPSCERSSSALENSSCTRNEWLVASNTSEELAATERSLTPACLYGTQY